MGFRRQHLMAAATVAFLLGACQSGGDISDAPDDAPVGGDAADPDAAEQSPGAAAVDIVDNAFEPQQLEVAVGDTVEWTNTGEATHTVTFDDGPDSGNLDSGATFSHTFEAAGDLGYVCSIHPNMEGTVVVSE